MSKKLFVVTCVLIISLWGTCAIAKVFDEHKQQAKDSESYKLWKHDFKDEKIVKLEALPGTFVCATTVFTSKKQAKEAPVLQLIDGKNGTVIWSGSENSASIVAGDPFPVIIEQNEQALNIQALKRSGEKAWEVSLPMVSISAAVDTKKQELMILSAAGKWWQADSVQPAVFSIVSLTDGSKLWQADLGEMSLPKVIPSTVMTAAGNSVWMAVGGRAILIDRQKQAVVFNEELPDTLEVGSAPVPVWYADENTAALALNKGVYFFDAQKGVVWSTPVTQKNAAPNSITVTENTVVAGYQILLKERSKMLVLAYERSSGKQLWNHIAQDGALVKWDRVHAPPEGIAVGYGKVVVCVRNALVWLDEITGEELQRIKLEAAEYHYAKKVERWHDYAVFYGKFHIRAYDLKTGQMVWRLEDFGLPKDFADAAQKLGRGIYKIGRQFASTLDDFSAQSMRSLANVKVAGRTGSGYSDYILSPSSRAQLISAA
ncbi:MAG: PQQ-binding-like beta-propeller repeat protein [Candidatus Omnitrophica bacterium]|nr:PQQ-binding-like beta-propeller repeat protein [Candidatus Omnitrophota bacterium]